MAKILSYTHGAKARRRSIFNWAFAGILVGGFGAAYLAAHLMATGLVDPWAWTRVEPRETVTAQFAICAGSARYTCIVDGDTFWLRGEKIRIADIDTPEVFSPACSTERAFGQQATRRLQALLNQGEFDLVWNAPRTDRYGRSLMVVKRDGRSLGEVLVAENLARRWDGARRDWCA